MTVRIKYQTLPPRQGIGKDLQVKIQAEYGRGLSYRQIKMDLDQRLSSSVELGTLNWHVLGLGTGRPGLAQRQ